MLTRLEATASAPWVCVRLRDRVAPVVEVRSPGSLNDLAAQWPTGETGELLVFRPGRRLFRTSLQVVARACRRGRILLPEEDPLAIAARIWVCGTLAGKPEALREAEFQIAAANQCLSRGAAPADTGIRLRMLEPRALPGQPFDRPESIDCLSPLEHASIGSDTVDIYLHPHPWAARACPLYRRIYLGYPRLQRFTLAHELAHLLGMPQRAHVDDNRYLERGNVMDASPTGGTGSLTLGQACIFNLDLESLAARIRAHGERRFPLRRMIDARGEAVRGPGLGFDFESPGDALRSG
ncbi:MAG: hypothetical protein IT169_18455 [Bryobacterales bacterium]|nr:hypothetical protein [Bryobacterales bacterium]